MFSLPNSWIIAMENDCENIQNDAFEPVEQYMFVVDDKHKIYHLKSGDGVKLVVSKKIKTPGKFLDISKLKSTDWMRMHITQRSLVNDGITYSLRTDLVSKMKIIDSTKSNGPNEEEDVYESLITTVD